ncbi:syntaxin 8 [Rhynchophorus ferrugineus]|uniref:syntaxin 8 n=1 Tax=Rhynchophorus ferrugineus TaxID=354439 RepID=UPI003FCD5701
MALLFLGEDPWLLEHESCEKLQREIMEQINERQKYARTSNKYGTISATVRLRLKQFNNEVQQLKEKLSTAYVSSAITLAESERRTRQVEVLETKYVQMLKIFDEQVSVKAMEERKDLFSSSGSNYEWAHSSTGASNMSVDEIRARQKQMLGEQNAGLENLSKIISRQKNIATAITDEAEFQNEIIDDIVTRVDQTDQRVRTETNHIETVDQKDNTCGYWTVIILLLISIVTVLCV